LKDFNPSIDINVDEIETGEVVRERIVEVVTALRPYPDS